MVIKCPNCNHFVSDTAEKCPSCGFKLKDDAAKDDSSTFDELVSFLLSVEESLRSYAVQLDNSVTICCYNTESLDFEVQIFIEASKKDTSDKELLNAREAYQKFKQSDYFPDFSVKEDECSEGYILLDCTSDCTSGIRYVVKMLITVFGITSPNQLHIEDLEDRNETGYRNEMENVNEIDDSEVIEEDSEDSAETWMNVLCFLIPIVGLILYFVKKNEYPNTANSYLKWAAVGFGVSLFINLIL